LIRYQAALLTAILSIPCAPALAQQDVPKAIVAVIGDADRLTIGQDGYCGERTEISSPSGKQFRIPANKESFFYIESRISMHTVKVVCKGEYSFIPEPGMLHIIRFTMLANTCKPEMFISTPGGDPRPASFQREEPRSCLFEKK
jgi:hypothetical protein